MNKKDKIYKKTSIDVEKLNPLIALAIILKENPERKEIKISSILSEERGLGKLFNLDMINLIQVLYKLERAGYIKVIRTAGLDVIRLEKDIDYITATKEYDNLLNN